MMKALQALIICLFAFSLIETATAATFKSTNYQLNDKIEKVQVGIEYGKTRQKNTWYKKQKSEINRGSIKVFLVAVGDNGKIGKKIGCGDSLVAITRRIKPTTATLKAAVGELLNLPKKYNGNLENFWGGNDLKLESVTIRKGVATIRLTGERLMTAGVCDEPRITLQIEETSKQFSTVKQVKVFINNQTLKQFIK